MRNNLFIICNLISIVAFIVIPNYVWVAKDWQLNEKVLTIIFSFLIETLLIGLLVYTIRKNNSV